MVGAQYRQTGAIDCLTGVNLHAIYYAVGTAVEDDALYTGQRRQLGSGNVVGMNLGVYAQAADLAGNLRILLTAQIQNQNHILLHRFLLKIIMEYYLYPIMSLVRDAIENVRFCRIWAKIE